MSPVVRDFKRWRPITTGWQHGHQHQPLTTTSSEKAAKITIKSRENSAKIKCWTKQKRKEEETKQIINKINTVISKQNKLKRRLMK